ncbi:MAG: hypothetical protein Q9181_007358 [Wetmoreana brouardii]
MAAIKTDAARLVKSLVEKYQEAGALGSLSCTVYDTAWVSMVNKVIDGKAVRLFPSSFQYILDSQQPDGGWLSYGSEINGIMNTAAALHALCHHKSARLRLDDALPLDLDSRIQRAEFALRQQLEKWDVGATLHVGYEILIPSLLDQLEAQGLFFEFPGKHRLLKAYSQKMKIFDAALLYSTEQYSALHSLEAFIGKVDFDKLKHNTRDGSMLASPSSTAAYLIHSSHWDEEAEAYLRRAISKGEGQGCGGVPGAFPSTNFDMIWTLSALFQGGFTLEELGMNEVDRISEVIGTSLERGGGLHGFDDTSKAITILQFLGKPAAVELMIKEFETFDHFQNYRFEKDPSFTVNCNVLACLLATDIQKPHWALLDIRLNIIPRKDMSEDRYFEYIPYTWTVSNNLKGAHLRGEFLHDMMITSFLNYQANKYMETCVSACFAGRLDDARSLIDHLFREHSPQKPGHSLSAQNGENGATNGAGFTSEARNNDITDGEGGTAKKRRVAEAAGDSGNGLDELRVWRPTVQEDDVTKLVP